MGNTGYKFNPNILFWVRLKTLHTNNDINRILEIAYIYTDLKLTVCQYGSHFAIQCSQEELDAFDQKELKYLYFNEEFSRKMGCTRPALIARSGSERRKI